MSEGLRTGQLTAATGIGRETLRYYERRGLLEEPQRTLGGHRLYPPGAVTRIRLIKAAQQLGFTLEEIADLAVPAGHRRGRDGGLRASARTKLAQVQDRIAALETVAALLREALSAGCEDLETCATSPGCPLPFPASAPELARSGR